MDGGELDVVAVQGLLDHGLVEIGGARAASLAMAAFGFGGHGHEQGAGAAGEVGHVQGPGELVVAPVHLRRPVVKTRRASRVAAGTEV